MRRNDAFQNTDAHSCRMWPSRTITASIVWVVVLLALGACGQTQQPAGRIVENSEDSAKLNEQQASAVITGAGSAAEQAAGLRPQATGTQITNPATVSTVAGDSAVQQVTSSTSPKAIGPFEGFRITVTAEYIGGMTRRIRVEACNNTDQARSQEGTVGNDLAVLQEGSSTPTVDNRNMMWSQIVKTITWEPRECKDLISQDWGGQGPCFSPRPPSDSDCPGQGPIASGTYMVRYTHPYLEAGTSFGPVFSAAFTA